jgi:nitrogenase molybdenum-cofactor synthesis protein NifE
MTWPNILATLPCWPGPGELVKEELARIVPQLEKYKKGLAGKKAAIYVGGSFKAFSLVKAFRLLDMQVVMVGSQTGTEQEYRELAEITDPGTIIVDDANPLELTSFLEEKEVDILVGGVKERPIAYKLGVGFCDHNHERKEALAGFQGMLNFAEEVYSSVMSPVWRFRSQKAEDRSQKGNILKLREKR